MFTVRINNFVAIIVNRMKKEWNNSSKLFFAQRILLTVYKLIRNIILKILQHIRNHLLRFVDKNIWIIKKQFMFYYRLTMILLHPANLIAFWYYKSHKPYKNSVLHISYMVHIPYDTTRLLRRFGMKADYLALERGGPVWDKSDYLFESHWNPVVHALREFYFFWSIIVKYEVIHSHFAFRLTKSGWEIPLLKRLGRKLVVQFRGCEIRNRERNMQLHPQVNICQQCDYNATICTDPARREAVSLAMKYGDLFLVTTPDMRDFMPEAVHFPFFLPQIDYEEYVQLRNARQRGDEIIIVHVTGHPGIEGTQSIIKAINNLVANGYKIKFKFLHLVSHDHVLREIAGADLTIGKMKMGYYANAQIESMFLGVPAITYVRPEFMTPELEASGFIFSTLDTLEDTLQYYLDHPEKLLYKQQIARSSILQLHDNERLGNQMLGLYEKLNSLGM